jgi:RNase H-like domain found in reverse transcriptase
VADKQSHLTERHSGKLGLYPHRKVHLDITLTRDQCTLDPTLSRTTTASLSVRNSTALPLKRSRPLRRYRLGLADFHHPKEGRLSPLGFNSREINKVIRRRLYQLLRIQDQEIHTNRTGYEFFTSLDISMQLYPFELDEESRNLCAIVTPFGKYRYCRLPMGAKVSPYVAKKIESHLVMLETILTRLQDNGFTINSLQCKMGHRLARPWTPHSNRPQAVAQEDRAPTPFGTSQIRHPSTPIRRCHHVLGNLFRRRSHVLAPFTALIGTKKFDWTPECDRAFNAMTALLSKDNLLRYLDPILPFHVYKDASELQLGSVIHQNDAPVVYFSPSSATRKRAIRRSKKELLSRERFAQFYLAPSSTCIPATATYCPST